MNKRKYVKEKHNYVITRGRIVPAKNLLLRFYQQYIMPYVRLGHLYNLYKVDDK